MYLGGTCQEVSEKKLCENTHPHIQKDDKERVTPVNSFTGVISTLYPILHSQAV